MPQENLTKHQLRGIRKTLAAHENRIEQRERRQAHALERASSWKGGASQRWDWTDGEFDSEPVARRTQLIEEPPRTSALVRGAGDSSRRNSGRDQVIAANIDLVVVVCSPAAPPFRPGLVDRYLVAAARDGLGTVICLNKADLGLGHAVAAELDGYTRLGIQVVHTSAATGEGVTALRTLIEGRRSLFSGHSGVGKSSLLNALIPDLGLRVGAVTATAAGLGKGRHTTTAARLIALPTPNTYVFDSPGVRMFGIRGIPPEQLAGYFPDLAAAAAQCRFRGCLHRGEEGCAVENSTADDPFLQRRLSSYQKMLEELR